MGSDFVTAMRERALAESWALRDEAAIEWVAWIATHTTPAEGWATRAACAGVDTDVFFPELGRDGNATARRICVECPVLVDCLATHLTEQEGVWGGLTRLERKKVRKAARRMGWRLPQAPRCVPGWKAEAS